MIGHSRGIWIGECNSAERRRAHHIAGQRLAVLPEEKSRRRGLKDACSQRFRMMPAMSLLRVESAERENISVNCWTNLPLVVAEWNRQQLARVPCDLAVLWACPDRQIEF